jgi:hypothetical protein
MNIVDIGTDTAQFPVKKYTNGIFLAVWVKGNKAALLPLLLTWSLGGVGGQEAHMDFIQGCQKV